MARLRGPIGSLQPVASRVDALLFLPRCADQCTHEGGEHIGLTRTWQVVVSHDDGATETYELDDVNWPLVGELPDSVYVEDKDNPEKD